MAAVLCAEQPITPTERLEHARKEMIERAGRVPDYTCVQTIERPM